MHHDERSIGETFFLLCLDVFVVFDDFHRCSLIKNVHHFMFSCQTVRGTYARTIIKAEGEKNENYKHISDASFCLFLPSILFSITLHKLLSPRSHIYSAFFNLLLVLSISTTTMQPSHISLLLNQPMVIKTPELLPIIGESVHFPVDIGIVGIRARKAANRASWNSEKNSDAETELLGEPLSTLSTHGACLANWSSATSKALQPIRSRVSSTGLNLIVMTQLEEKKVNLAS